MKWSTLHKIIAVANLLFAFFLAYGDNWGQANFHLTLAAILILQEELDS